MNSTGVALFAGLSRIAELRSAHERARAIAHDLVDWGMRRADVHVFDQAGELTQAAAGESSLRWRLDARPASLRALFDALASFEGDGVTVGSRPVLESAAPEFVVEGDASASSLLLCRLIAAERIVGLIVVDTGSQTPAAEQMAHLRSYCDVTATLFDSERIALRASRDAERSDVLARIGRHTRHSLDRRKMLELIVGDVREAFKAARCVFYERDKVDRRALYVVALDDVKAIQAPLPRTHRVEPGSAFERVVERGEIVALEEIGDEPEYVRARAYGMRALLSGPIVAEDGSIEAVVSIHFAREHRFDQVDIVLLRSIITQVGLALANARLYEKEQQARRRAEMLERNLRALRVARTLEEILATVTETIVAEFGACGSVWSIRDGRFHCEAAAARKEAVLPSYAVGTSVTIKTPQTDALRREEILLTRVDPDLWAEVASKEAMIAPLIIDHELWGFLAARIDLRPGETDDDRLKFLATLASHTALVLGNAQAFEHQHRFALERSVLSEAARLILTYNDPEALANAATRLAMGLSAADRVEIYVPRGGELLRVGCASSWDDCGAPKMLALDDPFLGATLASGETRLENDGHTAILALPSTDHVAGILACYRDLDDTAPFDAEDVRFLESFCAMLGLGLRNCELYAAQTVANYALARSGEFKDDLLTMFTHDFKAPLAVIMGRAELLLETQSGEVRDGLAVIYAQGERLTKLADDAMRLARAQASEFELERTSTDLAAFLDEALAGIGSDRLDLLLPDDDPIRVWIDRARLRQAIDNVAGNALKYSSGRVEVRVDLAHGAVRIVVRDRGIGIPASERERIFARFGRGSNARMHGIAGSGVGLYTSRKIVEAHGGTIEVESVQDEGSTFTITIPTLIAADRADRAHPKPAATG